MFGGRQRGSFAAVGTSPAPPPENALIACMGADFARLPELVQRAHRGTIRLTGSVKVERSRGLGWLVAALLRLPRSNPAAELVVTGWHFPEQMVWSRSFDGRVFESTFSLDDDFLVEQMGPFSLVLQPMAEGGRLVYRLAAVNLGPITLPRFLAPSMTAWESEKEGKYAFEVAIGLPLLGRVIRYAGTLELQVLAT